MSKSDFRQSSSVLGSSSKRHFITRMFEDISDRYDFLNRVISFGLDGLFRKKAVRIHSGDQLVLDICAGTGDMAKELLKDRQFKGAVVLADLSPKMLKIAMEKMRRIDLPDSAECFFVFADAEHMPFKQGSFDGIISGFSLRNLGNLEKFGRELSFVLRQGGQASLLDIAHPSNRIYAWLFHLYFYRLVPLFSQLFTRKKYAYRYLPASLRVFYRQPEVLRRLKGDSLSGRFEDLLGGIAAIYRLSK